MLNRDVHKDVFGAFKDKPSATVFILESTSELIYLWFNLYFVKSTKVYFLLIFSDSMRVFYAQRPLGRILKNIS